MPFTRYRFKTIGQRQTRITQPFGFFYLFDFSLCLFAFIAWISVIGYELPRFVRLFPSQT
jgi:hypothetical protein